MISRGRLQHLSRARELPLVAIELDYVNAWVLHAIYSGDLRDTLAFKGGTALSKLYFPGVWRFSEDLDFTAIGKFDRKAFETALKATSGLSGVAFELVSFHRNPGFIRIRVQFQGVLGYKNTTLVEVSLDEPLVFPVNTVAYQYEDVPETPIRAYAIEEIFVEKLRSLFQRARARDYYDLFYLLEHRDFDDKQTLEKLKVKCAAKNVNCDFSTFPDPEKIQEIQAYWDNALARLTSRKPAFNEVLMRIRGRLQRLLAVE